jgi:hypothetical protein
MMVDLCLVGKGNNSECVTVSDGMAPLELLYSITSHGESSIPEPHNLSGGMLQ